MKQSFVSSRGLKIQFVDGWFDLIPAWPCSCATFAEYGANLRSGADAYPTGDSFLVNKLVTANTVYDTLRQYGLGPRFPRMLDICTGPAVQPRAFKALGFCDEVHGVDIHSREDHFPGERIAVVWSTLKDWVLEGNGTTIGDVFFAINRMQAYINNCFNFVHKDFDAERLTMDSYAESDFLEYKPDRPFDLVTLNAGMEYFEVEPFFAKLAEVTQPGGVFITFNDYFYHVFAASMSLPMDAPWLHARVSRKDFERYWKKARPELDEAYSSAYYFAHTHHTVQDYIAVADRHGFDLVAYMRNMDDERIRNICFDDGANARAMYGTILPECQALNPTVSIEDLFTYYLTMVLRKRG